MLVCLKKKKIKSIRKQKPENIPNIYLCLSHLDAIASETVFFISSQTFREINLRPTFESDPEMWEFQVV